MPNFTNLWQLTIRQIGLSTHLGTGRARCGYARKSIGKRSETVYAVGQHQREQQREIEQGIEVKVLGPSNAVV